MHIPALVLLMMLSFITPEDRSDCARLGATQHPNAASDPGSQIKISIATGGGPYRPAKDTYQVGLRIPVVITMTNTGSQPVYVCESGTLYQDRPQLLKNGKPLPYMAVTQSAIQAAAKQRTCN